MQIERGLKVKGFIKKLRKKLSDLDKPMIFYGKLAVKALVFIHLLNNFMIVVLTYDNDDFIITTLVYLLTSNIIVFKCVERLWR